MTKPRWCCCDDYPAGAHCFEFSFSPGHGDFATHTIDLDTCTEDWGDPCGTVTLYTAQIDIVRGAYHAVTALPVLMAKDWGVCTCGDMCVYEWTPPESTWDAAIRWCTADCESGSGVITSTNLISIDPVSSPCNPFLGGWQITFGRNMPGVTIGGACGDLEIPVNGFGSSVNHTTTVTLVYCCREGTSCCILDLYSVSMGATHLTPQIGAVPVIECYCDSASGPIITDTGTVSGSYETAAGGFGTLYALAGSPPLVLTCVACPPA